MYPKQPLDARAPRPPWRTQTGAKALAPPIDPAPHPERRGPATAVPAKCPRGVPHEALSWILWGYTVEGSPIHYKRDSQDCLTASRLANLTMAVGVLWRLRAPQSVKPEDFNRSTVQPAQIPGESSAFSSELAGKRSLNVMLLKEQPQRKQQSRHTHQQE